METIDNLLDITRNKEGDYYFIFKVDGVHNNINTKAKPRNEVIIVGVPHDKLISFLKGMFKNADF